MSACRKRSTTLPGGLLVESPDNANIVPSGFVQIKPPQWVGPADARPKWPRRITLPNLGRGL